MMQWLNSPRPTMERRVVQPGATFSLFENHWKQATDAMESSQDADGALTVIQHLNQMITFLRVSRGEVNSETSCKAFWLQNQCSEKVIKWLHNLQINGLKLPSDCEVKLVEVLHSLCQIASRDGEILGYSSDNSGDQNWDGAYSLASLLLEYSLRSDPQIGSLARYSFILLIQLASKFPGLEKSLIQESRLGLTNVVISGLSACFSQLPTFTNSSAEQLEAFIVQLEFVEKITEAAGSDNVASIIAECFHDGFLLNVIEPAVTQDEGSRRLHSEHDPYLMSLHEEIAVVTKYLQIVCEQLTHPFLNRTIIQFITARLLPTLLRRLNHMNVSITVATLSLFTVLLEFYCEDFWHELILQYLIPENHLMVSQRLSLLPDVDFYDASVRFLALIPTSVIEALGSETLTNHYVQYLNSESARLTHIDSMVSLISTASALQSKSQHHSGQNLSDADDETSENESTNQNVIYRFWKYKYDGMDSFDTKSLSKSPPKKDTKADADIIKVKSTAETSTANTSAHPLEHQADAQFSVISLTQPESEDILTEAMTTNVPSDTSNKTEMVALSVLGNTSEGYASMDSSSSPLSDSTTAFAQIASFGPFLDSILVQLSGWENQSPDVSLVLSELVSVLASSRIPLINTILLDPNLTLQPSYVTFMSLLKRIREDLDFRMKTNCSAKVIADVWTSMSSISNANKSDSRRTSLSTTSTMAISPLRIGDTLGKTIMDRISSGGSGVASLTSAFNSVFGRKSNSPQVASPSPTRSQSTYSISPQGPSSRIVNTTQVEQTEASKTLAKRAIIFSHWLLELGAIAQQLSWKRT